MDTRRRGRPALARLGAVLALIALPLVGIGPAAPAGAAVDPTLRVAKVLGAERVADTDQFTVFAEDAADLRLAESTTTGTGMDVDGGTGDTGVVTVATGAAYEIGEEAAGTTVLADYTATVECTDANGVMDDLPDGAEVPVTITPEEGAAVFCLIANAPVAPEPPTLEVVKALSGPRAADTDQFTVGIAAVSARPARKVVAPALPAAVAPGPVGPIVSDPTNATTTGTGSAVDAGSGTTGTYVGFAGVPYEIGESASGTTDLDGYDATIDCVDAAGLQPDLPDDEAYTGPLMIELVDAAEVTCTITNTAIVVPPAAPTLTVTKAYGSDRVDDTDQFNVSIARNSIIVADGTTTGAGSTVDPGTGTTGAFTATAGTTYEVMELALGTADSADYDATIDCVDAAGLQTGLPDDAPMDTGGSVSITPVGGAVITCTITNTVPAAADPTITVVKTMNGPRIDDTDQFTVQVSDTGVPVASSTTTGTGEDIDAGTGVAGPVAVAAGTEVEVEEVAAGTTDLNRYRSRLTCDDANDVQQDLPEDVGVGEGLSEAITVEAGAAITCTITNTARSATIQVEKALAGDRVTAGDQFTVGIADGTTPVAVGPNRTTSGTGATVDPDTGITGLVSVGTDTAYRVFEVGAGTTDLGQYDATISCFDADGYQSGLPVGAALGESFTFTPVAGAAIYCTITNTAAAPLGPPTIEVTKVLSDERVADTDQFTVIITGDLASVATGTTTGTGSTVDAGTGTTGVYVADAGIAYGVLEAEAGTTELDDYEATIDCEDANGLQAGLPDDEPYTGMVILVPTAGAAISCTITNDAIDTSTIELDKALATYRSQLDDEFTVEVTEDGTVVNDTSASTTAGVGADITAGTGTTGPFAATPGQTYALGEVGVAATDLADYTATIDCVDANGLQTGLPDDAPYTQPVAITPVADAAISCTITNTSATADILVSKQLAGPRHDDSDQFTVRLLDGATVVRSSTTGGIGSDVTIGTGNTGFADVPAGTTYTIDELAVGTTDLSDYATTIGCVDSAGVTDPDDLPDGQDLTQVAAITPAPGALIICNVFNTPRPRIRVLKSLGTLRDQPSDQFRVVVVTQDLTVVADSTTSGTGDTVDPGTGDTGAYGATAGVTYEVGELAAGTTDLLRYEALITCLDANGVQPDLPATVPYVGPVAITPVAGADIVCSIVNRAAPTIEVRAGFANDRAQPGDQVTVGISGPGDPVARIAPGPEGPVVSDPTHATTSGTGSTVDPGTGTTGPFVARADATYGIGETGAGTTDLDDYTATLTCVDAAGLQTDLPTDEPLSGTIEITPVTAARITCTITNRASTAVVENASITKEIVGSPTRVGTDGYDVAYRLTVENVGTVATSYDLEDELLFGAGVTITSATVANTTPGDIAVAADWDGRTQPLIVAAQSLDIGAIHVYDVTVRIVVDSSATTTSLDCQIDPGETGTGVTNSSTLGAATSEAEAEVAVCAAVEGRDIVVPTVVDPVIPFTPGGPTAGPLARTGAALTTLMAVGLALVALGAVLVGGRRRPHRRSTDPRRRDRISSLLDHTP